MNAPRAKIIFHIGQHKTGSKALQAFCAHHARALEERGVLYATGENSSHGIPAYARSHYHLFALLRAEALEVCGEREAAAHFRNAHGKFCEPYGSLRELFEALEARRVRAGAHTILLSAEDLFDMHSAHETQFSTALVDAGAGILARCAEEYRYDPLVAVYLRRQDHLLGAHYVQYIKGSATNDMDFESFAATFAPRLYSSAILAPWASVFGDAHIRARAYEPATVRTDIVADFFGNILGFPIPAGWTTPPRDVESVNATPCRDHVEFMRMLNRKTRDGLPVPPREDVLAAAFAESSSGYIAEWMSPEARRALLEIHALGNDEIAARFTHPRNPTLFNEPPPHDDSNWRAYPGLPPERVKSIEQKIREMKSPQRSGWGEKISSAIARLSGRT